MHNLYPVLLHDAARTASDTWSRSDPTGDEPWFYVRSGHSGAVDRLDGRGVSAFTTGTFPGDETTDWAEGSGLPSVVPAMLNLALGGAGTFSTDVGGYFDFVAPQPIDPARRRPGRTRVRPLLAGRRRGCPRPGSAAWPWLRP